MSSKLRLCALGALLLSACGEGNLDMRGMFYTLAENADERFEQSLAYNEEHGYKTVAVPADNYKVYLMTDAHIDFTANNLDEFIKIYKDDASAAPFVLNLGDIINATNHWEFMMEHLEPIWNDGSSDMLFSTLGNHDMYYDQWKIWREYFHTSSYWFEVKGPTVRDLYISLDSADGTAGAKQRQWLEKLLAEKSQEGYRHIVIFTHTHFFKKDASQGHTSNFALEETMELIDLFSRYGVDLIIQGHSHHRDYSVFRGIKFLRLDALEDHYYNAFYSTMDVGTEFSWTYFPIGPQIEGEQVVNPDVPR